MGAAVVAFFMLILPAIWNGYPLLQYDTGGYIARWYEGYLVPSRSTAFGLYLTASETPSFWPALVLQSAVTVWVSAITLRTFGLGRNPWRLAAIMAALSVVTTLPWLTSILLTDIFAGLAVLALYLLVFRAGELKRWEAGGLFLVVAFSAASHTATFTVLLALIGAGFVIRKRLRAVVPPRGLVRGFAAVAAGASLLLATNFVLSREIAWTPGGTTIPFGRILQDGIVARYLKDHCPQLQLKLCPYRTKLPATADAFLWGGGIFNDLGRFAGLGDEMRRIFLHSLVAYPWDHVRTALRATLVQLVLNGTGEGVHDKLWHTYGIIQRYLPAEVPVMRLARQQHGALTFDRVNLVHRPVALLSLLVIVILLARAWRRGERDEFTLLAATVALAILVNAFVCGAISGPHDRYGARLAWVPVFVITIALMRARWFPREAIDDMRRDPAMTASPAEISASSGIGQAVTIDNYEAALADRDSLHPVRHAFARDQPISPRH
jgi:hypothetical protein